jgi:hypothetical protein
VEPADRLTVGRRGVVELVPESGREGDEVVEPRADGVGVDEEDLDAPGEDVPVDPRLPLRGGDLAGVEPGDARGDLAGDREEPLGEGRAAAVAEEDEDPLASPARLAELGLEPALLGCPPRRGEASPAVDELASEALGIAEAEGLEVVGRAVEVGGELDQGSEEPAGASLDEAIGLDPVEEPIADPQGDGAGGARRPPLSSVPAVPRTASAAKPSAASPRARRPAQVLAILYWNLETRVAELVFR